MRFGNAAILCCKSAEYERRAEVNPLQSLLRSTMKVHYLDTDDEKGCIVVCVHALAMKNLKNKKI